MADRQTQGHRLGVLALAAGLAVLPLGLPNDYYLDRTDRRRAFTRS